jgi:hypothetical protein
MKTYQILILLILMGLVSCRKDKTPPIDSECFNFPQLSSTWHEEHRLQHKAPSFNPLNSNEFVYYYKDNELGVFQLVKYNMVTNQKTILINSVRIHGQPKWSNNGWIAFTEQPSSYVEHIFVLKDNGDSLTQITSSPANLNPIWDNITSELFWTHSPDLGSEWYLFRQKLNHHTHDTVDHNWGVNISDLRNNLILHKRNINGIPYYGYFDLANSLPTQNSFYPISNLIGATSGISWHPSGLFFYITHSNGYGRGLYRINLYGDVEPLVEHCDSKRYSIIHCSSDGKKLIAERVDSFLEYNNESNPTGKIIQKSSIWLIDTQTLKEEKINID